MKKPERRRRRNGNQRSKSGKRLWNIAQLSYRKATLSKLQVAKRRWKPEMFPRSLTITKIKKATILEIASNQKKLAIVLATSGTPMIASLKSDIPAPKTL